MPLLDIYKNELGIKEMPEFLNKYLQTPSLQRLKKINYFCGMNYASKNVYDFKEDISRFDHSLTVSLLTWKLTHNKIETLAGLYHDIATPCFSHVIDYMNKDYEKQESTEEFTEDILSKDKLLLDLLKEDNISKDRIINFKDYSIVDNNRPKLCADRLDGIILTGISWTENIDEKNIKDILNNITIFKNEDNEDEIGFTDKEVANKVLEVSEAIDIYCHSSEDNYMMELLAYITKKAIKRNIITYEDLYELNEEDVFYYLSNTIFSDIRNALNLFKNIKKEVIPVTNIENVKVRDINPLVNGKRLVKKKEVNLPFNNSIKFE